MTKKELDELRKAHPHTVPLRVASQYLEISERRLSALVAEGREPFCHIGANIGNKQRYVRIYTERLIAYLTASGMEE